jgi:hypothetical protein
MLTADKKEHEVDRETVLLRIGASPSDGCARAESPIHLWNLYETGCRPVSISDAGVGKYPPREMVQLSIPHLELGQNGGLLPAH